MLVVDVGSFYGHICFSNGVFGDVPDNYLGSIPCITARFQGLTCVEEITVVVEKPCWEAVRAV